jgi:hypothetical protein
VVGRGLSELQKTILTIAAEEKDDPKRHNVALYNEVLARHYGWQTKHRYRGDVGPQGWHFSKADIGEKEYRKARAALSRSASRLAERGLVEFMQFVLTERVVGVRLIDEGVEIAKRLNQA